MTPKENDGGDGSDGGGDGGGDGCASGGGGSGASGGFPASILGSNGRPGRALPAR